MSTHAIVRNAPSKPPKGEMRAAHRAKSDANRAREQRLKRESKELDGHQCRWPGCACGQARRGQALRRLDHRLESAHLGHKGSGGDPQLRRTTLETLITLCAGRHRGARSLDSGDLDITPLTDRGTRGPCEFFVLSPSGKRISVGKETAVGVLERPAASGGSQ